MGQSWPMKACLTQAIPDVGERSVAELFGALTTPGSEVSLRAC